MREATVEHGSLTFLVLLLCCVAPCAAMGVYFFYIKDMCADFDDNARRKKDFIVMALKDMRADFDDNA